MLLKEGTSSPIHWSEMLSKRPDMKEVMMTHDQIMKASGKSAPIKSQPIEVVTALSFNEQRRLKHEELVAANKTAAPRSIPVPSAPSERHLDGKPAENPVEVSSAEKTLESAEEKAARTKKARAENLKKAHAKSAEIRRLKAEAKAA